MSRVGTARRRVMLTTNRPISDLHDGIHAAVHTGRSQEFNDLREYVHGDDTSDIDWKASARHGSLLVRRDVAERRLTLLLAVGAGGQLSGMAGPEHTKAQVAVEVAAVLGALATGNGDRVGMLWPAATGIRRTRPSSRDLELERALAALEADCTSQRPASNLTDLLQAASSTLRRRALVVIVCDDVELSADDERWLRRLTAQHDVMLVGIGDLDPATAPGARLRAVEDQRLLPPPFLADAELLTELRAERAARQQRRSAVLSRLSIVHLDLPDPTATVPQVLDLVRRHKRAR